MDASTSAMYITESSKIEPGWLTYVRTHIVIDAIDSGYYVS